MAYNINTTIINGELLVPSASAITIETSSQTFQFKGNDGLSFNKMVVNDNIVNPELLTEANVSISTNYGTYRGSLNNLLDGSSSTIWWSNQAQLSGKYILLTFSAPITLTSFSTISTHKSDYVHSNNVLQVSSDNSSWTTIGTFENTQTSSFTGITNAVDIKYVRIYAQSDVSNWLQLSQISFTYEINGIYQYTLTNISSNINVRIVFGPESTIYVKTNDGKFTEHVATFVNVDGSWSEVPIEQLYIYLKNKTILYNT